MNRIDHNAPNNGSSLNMVLLNAIDSQVKEQERKKREAAQKKIEDRRFAITIIVTIGCAILGAVLAKIL